MANNSSSSTVIDIPAALRSQGNVNVIGVVVDVFQGVFKTANSLCITFTLKSDNLKNGHVWDGLKVKYFKANESQLPPVQEGDVVLLRNIWIRNYNGKPLGIAGDRANVPWAIFRFDPDPLCANAPICGPTPFEPSYSEKRRCQSLLESISGLSEFRNSSALQVTAPQSFTTQVSCSPQDARTQRKLTAIKDIREGMLVDLIGEVIKLYPQNSEKALLYLSDYTTNKKLQDHPSVDDDGDSFYRSRKKWAGPPGQMSLPVTLWEPHASFARENIKDNDIISLKYVHIKANRHNLTIEASMHSARYNNVHLVDTEKNDYAKELLRRKKDYYRGINTGKRKAEEDAKPTKGLKARNKKRLEGMKEESEATRQLKERNRPNEHVKASYEGVRGRRIEDIVTSEFHEFESHDGVEYRLPFQNLCYKTTVRVVDFFPPNIKDFAVPQQPKENHSGSRIYQDAEDDGVTRWEWRFCLLIEDALPPPPGQPKEQIKLFVSDANAEFLLKMSATDLRKDPEQLAILRERLFILWGDLEERKKTITEESGQGPLKLDRASSRPFTCCIQEYGVRCSHLSDADAISYDTSGCSREDCFGWERRFGIFQTTIDS